MVRNGNGSVTVDSDEEEPAAAANPAAPDDAAATKDSGKHQHQSRVDGNSDNGSEGATPPAGIEEIDDDDNAMNRVNDDKLPPIGPTEIDDDAIETPSSPNLESGEKNCGQAPASESELGSIHNEVSPLALASDAYSSAAFADDSDSENNKNRISSSVGQESVAYPTQAGSEVQAEVDQNFTEQHQYYGSDTSSADEDEENPEPRANANLPPDLESDQSDTGSVIPEPFMMEGRDDDIMVDAYAEPDEPLLLPWRKQRMTKILFSFGCILTVVAAVAIAMASPPDDKAVTEEVIPVEETVSETYSPTSLPMRTMNPSSIQTPSYSPTSCGQKITAMAQTLDLPFPNPTRPRMAIHGRNAAIAARESDSDLIHLTFYALKDDDDDNSYEWSRDAVFAIKYPDSNLDDIYDYDVAISGTTAFLGLPLNREGAGLVYIFEQSSLGLWESVEEPLVPKDGSEGAHFGHRVSIGSDGLAVVSAFDGRTIYLFQKMNTQWWMQLSKLDLNYNPYEVFLLRQSMLVVDIDSSDIHFYDYDENVRRVRISQDPLIGNPQGLMNQIMQTGTARRIYGIRASEDYFVYSTLKWVNGDWISEGVFVYKRQNMNQQFTLLQFLDASDYEEGFGRNLALGKDVLIIGVGDATQRAKNGQSYVFVKRDGIFEESFVFDEAYDLPEISGWNAIALGVNNAVVSLDLEECTLAPTQTSTIRPTSTSLPTSTPIPSAMPSFSSFPSISLVPSQSQTLSLAPTICYSVKITIVTTGANTEGFEEDLTYWQLYEKQSGEVILQSSQLKEDQLDEYVVDCLQENDYVFSISNSRGNGFGECDTCGYFIFVDDVAIGGSVSFFDNEKLTFTLPVGQGEPDADAQPFCSGDFFLSLYTGMYPEKITWYLASEDGDTVLAGGPYQKTSATYREFACLPPTGSFTFTIDCWRCDSGSSSSAGSYFIGISNDQILAGPVDLNSDTSGTTTFSLGTENIG